VDTVQVIYAALFILLSVIAFSISLAVPRLRPYIFRALIAPVGFGFCSIVGTVFIVLLSEVVIKRLGVGPPTGVRGVMMALLIYFLPGLAGAWLCIEIVKKVERRWLSTQPARNFAVLATIASIVFIPALLVCIGVSDKLTKGWASSHVSLLLPFALIVAVLAAVVTFTLLRAVQQRVQAKSKQSSYP